MASDTSTHRTHDKHRAAGKHGAQEYTESSDQNSQGQDQQSGDGGVEQQAADEGNQGLASGQDSQGNGEAGGQDSQGNGEADAQNTADDQSGSNGDQQ
jgi:hypothetical protein